MFKRFFISLGLLAILLTSCQNSQLSGIRILTPSGIAPLSTETGVYPPPTDPTPEPYRFRTSEPGTTTLHGKLLVTDPDNALPAPNDSIYLVPLPAGDKVIMVQSIPFDTALQADVNEQTGEFVFTNVQPGKYIVMIVTIHKGQISARRQDENLAIIKVEESDQDRTIELNNLIVP